MNDIEEISLQISNMKCPDKIKEALKTLIETDRKLDFEREGFILFVINKDTLSSTERIGLDSKQLIALIELMKNFSIKAIKQFEHGAKNCGCAACKMLSEFHDN